jgi:aerobic carbon-monoxide dehydrogenase small subunit
VKHHITLRVNGQAYEVAVENRTRLLDALRDLVGVTGPKEGCGTGDCGACTVLLDGKPVTSCLVLAVSAQGKEIITVEGLAKDGVLHPVQRAFVERGGLQCGFCTPGMLLSTKALLDENPRPTCDEIRVALAGNLCRCTGYEAIVEAVERAAELLAAERAAALAP